MSIFKINAAVMELIDVYSLFHHEVGGILFGEENTDYIDVKSLSFKHGEKYKIDFTNEDRKLFSGPEGMSILGTWHTHPFQSEPFASNIDITQWKKWNKKYYHMVVGEKKLKFIK